VDLAEVLDPLAFSRNYPPYRDDSRPDAADVAHPPGSHFFFFLLLPPEDLSASRRSGPFYTSDSL
jgi:hypothetical protein